MKLSSSISLLVLIAFALPTFSSDEFPSNTQITGVIEMEAGFADGNSDFSLTTVEVGLDHSLNSQVEGHILFLYEGGEGNIVVDEATLTLRPTKKIALTAGRFYVPFGHFDSNMISDPLTLELGETQEEALQLAYSLGHFSSQFYLFKDANDGSNKLDDYGINIAFTNNVFGVGLGIISDVNELSSTNSSAKGIDLHGRATFGAISLIAEHLRVDKTKNGKKPQATQLEIDFDLGKTRTLAVALQQTKNAAELPLPKKSLGLTYSMKMYKKVGLAAEVIRNKAYDDKEDTITTLKLSYEF